MGIPGGILNLIRFFGRFQKGPCLACERLNSKMRLTFLIPGCAKGGGRKKRKRKRGGEKKGRKKRRL